VAFIGFGEAGQTIGRGLLAAKALGVEVARDHVGAVREADIVFLAVTASSSLEAALSCLPGLREGQLFLDINSVSPRRKIETAVLMRGASGNIALLILSLGLVGYTRF